MEMNKKRLILICLILTFSCCAYAEQVDKTILPQFSDFDAMYINEGMVNGRHWKTFGEKEKETYLFGYQDGLINTAIYYVPDENDKAEVIESFPPMLMGVIKCTSYGREKCTTLVSII